MHERIAGAAYLEIKRRGLKFSMRDVAGRLGISTKTLYQHFASKDELIGYLVESSITEMRETEQAVLNDDKLSDLEKLVRALNILPAGIAFGDAHTLQELEKAYPAHWRAVDEYLNQGWDNVRLLVHAGVSSGELRPFDMELFIRVYVGAVYELMNGREAGRLGLSFEDELAGTVEFLLDGIRRHEGAGV